MSDRGLSRADAGVRLLDVGVAGQHEWCRLFHLTAGKKDRISRSVSGVLLYVPNMYPVNVSPPPSFRSASLIIAVRATTQKLFVPKVQHVNKGA